MKEEIQSYLKVLDHRPFNKPERIVPPLKRMIALLLHAEAGEARYRIEVPRVKADLTLAEFDHKLNYRFEKFFIVKK